MRLHLILLCGLLIQGGCETAAKPMTADAEVEHLELRPLAVPAPELSEEVNAAQPPAPGEKQFNSYCAACHQRGGQGAEGRVPPLNDSPWVSGSEDRLIRIVLNGLHGPIEIGGDRYNLEMPAFRMLFRDDDIASLLSYVRQRYGAPSPPIAAETVSRVRQETQHRIGYWTVEELLQIP